MGSRQLLYADDSWMTGARCQGARHGELFPVTDVDQREAARKWCDGCPVAAHCLEYALACNLEWGVWGGRTERERRVLRVQRRRAAVAPPTPERCRNGHPLVAGNTRWVSERGRPRWRCVTCQQETQRRARALRKAAAGA